MNRFRACASVLLIIAMAAAGGCLRVTKQRITVHHDQANDRLTLLVHYDGIHDSEDGQFGNGARQLEEAVENGEALFMDWPLHFQPQALRGWAPDGDPQPWHAPARRLAGNVLKQVRIEPVGWYRSADGQIGGLQKITISKVSALLGDANAAISAGILAVQAAPSSEWRHTWTRMRGAAQDKHAWLSLDGHAIVGRIPVHPGEFAYAKAQVLTDLPGQVEQDRPGWLRFVQALAGAPIAFEESDGMVTVRLGDPKKPGTLRVNVGHEYKANMEDAVKRLAKVNLDEKVASVLLDRNAPADEAVGALLAWGPPEVRARALLNAVSGDNAQRAARAAAALEALGRQWNASEGVPAAPTVAAASAEFTDQWKHWLGTMSRYPLLVDIPNDPADEPPTLEEPAIPDAPRPPAPPRIN